MPKEAPLISAQRAIFGTHSEDPYDQSWIQKWAAIGDSYAAGLGVGARQDYSCSRYDGGYPDLISQDDRFGQNPNRTSQFLACSGLKSTQILLKQIPRLEDNL